MGGAVGIVLSILGALSSALPAIEGDMAARQNREVQAAIHREVDLSRRLPPKSRMNAKLAALRLSWRLPPHQSVFAKPMLSARTQWQRDLSDGLFDREFEQ